MTDLATTQSFDAERVIAMLGLNPRDPKTAAMVAVCQRYQFDPLLKHVVVIPQGGVYITRDGLLHAAHRSGQFDGMVLESGPDLVDGEWRCVVSVYRKDMGHPFTFPGRYSATGGNRKYAPEMAIKVAECMALRRAFDVSGMGVLEEAEAGAGPAPTARPVERIAATPADDPYYAQPVDAVIVDVATGEVLDPGAADGGEAAAAPDYPPDYPPGHDRTTGAPIPYGPDALIDVKSSHSKRMYAQLRQRVSADKTRQLAWCAAEVGRSLASSAELTQAEQSRLLDRLDRMPPLGLTTS